MPLPYVEVMKSETSSLTDENLLAIKRGVNAVVLALNYLHLGRPRRAPVSIRLGARLSRGQWEAVHRIQAFVEGWSLADSIGPEEMGRNAGKVESIEDMIHAIEARAKDFGLADVGYMSSRSTARAESEGPTNAAGEVVGRSDHEGYAAFKPIEPERLAFHGSPSFDPRPYLDPVTWAIFEDPVQFAIQPEEYPGNLPRVRVHCSYDKKIQLFNLLDASRRLRLVPPEDVNPKLCAGLFSVVKSSKKDRLILDARPRNCLELPVERWIGALAGGEALCNIVVPEGYDLKSSSNDLRDFYYYFSVSDARCRRNVLCGAVETSDVKHLACFEESLLGYPKLYGALNSLAMGDLQAVAIAQTCHLGMAFQHRVVEESQLVTGRGPIPRGPDYFGVIIDDFVGISAVASGDAKPSRGARKSDEIEDVYRKEGLQPNEDKAERDCEIGQFWGVHLDGRLGILRGSMKRAIPLAGIAVKVARLGYCTVELAQILTGSFISLLLYRRRFLCILDALFQISRGRSPRDVVKLNGKCRSELLLLAAILPVACTNLRAQVSPRITATDASQWGEAACSASVPQSIATEVHRLVLRKPVWAKLLPPGKAWERVHGRLPPQDELPGEREEFVSNPLWEILAESLDYRLLYSRQAPRPRHINIGELRGMLRAEKILGRRSPSRREIYGMDSQVALGCVIKGRSSSQSLNKELELSLADMIAFDVYAEGIYFETSRNRADAPTRGRDIPRPSRQEPKWWGPLACGSYEPFDEWRAEFGLDDHAMRNLPPLEELGYERTAAPALALQPLCPTDEGLASAAGVERVISVSPSEKRLNDHWESVKAALGSFKTSQVVRQPGLAWPPDAKGYLDLYSGTRGVARALVKKGAAWCLCFDIKDGPDQDLECLELRSRIEWLIRAGAFVGLGAGPDCSSFSIAVTPPVRSDSAPYGKAGVTESMKEKLRRGNDHGLWVLHLCRLACDRGLGFWVENPASSWLFKLPEWKAWVEDTAGVGAWVVDYCRYNAPWRKRSRFLSNLSIRDSCTLCTQDHCHQRLRGRSSLHKQAWTRIAQTYPKGIAAAVADSLLAFCSTTRALSTHACARQTSRRIGEATNPGPARQRVPRLGALEAVPLVQASTERLQERVWAGFKEWLSAHVSDSASEDVFRLPALVALFLKEYGSYLYSAGEPIHLFRHLLALAPRQVVGLKPYMTVCWDHLSRWERVEPTEHRVPVPTAVVQAIMCVAILWGWMRFAASVGVIFYGITRPGEVLKATRALLILPRDLLLDAATECYLKIPEPKGPSGQQGPYAARQHTGLGSDPLPRCCLRGLLESEPLFPASASSFRRRWDRVLRALLVPGSANLTPGGLRGGGAVHAFRGGEPLPHLLWRMRLKHLVTLESYLQEVVALKVLPTLHAEARNRVSAASALFPVVLRAAGCP